MYNKVPNDLKFVSREKEVETFWRENRIFEKSIELREGSETFTFYDGPPTANGKPHIGHVLTRVIKDMIPRYRTMKGYHVLRKAGWDTHGLPVELEVEKKLGLDGKEQVEAYGLAPFIDECKESVWKYKGMWEDFSRTVGFWADMNDPYVTYDNSFIESEWWALKQIYEKKLLYRGFKIVPYCPRCGTPLSSHEVAQGYKDVKEKSAIAKFELLDEAGTFFLAWTTTPWTLPSNVALCVNPNEAYVKIAVGDVRYILAEALVSSVIKDDYTVLQKYVGKELEHTRYRPLFDFVKPQGNAYFVTCDNYVTLSDGTGIVHIAPAFGEDDARVGTNYQLAFVQLVDAKGQMTAETPWAGTFCKDADRLVLAALSDADLLFAALPFEHSYPHCWRCGTPLIYYARDSWFIRMTAVRDRLLANNAKINWIPESIGRGRFGDWLENVQDWGISRNRYWGTPLNIWECPCGHRHAVGSIEELKSMSKNCPDDIELHRPYIDAVTLVCPECGGEMTRVSEVIDCWFDSGAMPFAQWHYPFENKQIFDTHFPADFISEAVDQTRGWFYSLLAISTLIFDRPPYKNVIVLGHVQDENGQKMSKSKGNAVDPFEALEEYGADAIRWYFYSNSAPWLPNRFHRDAVIEGQRKFMGTLWNTYAFFVLYANIDGFDASKYTLDTENAPVMDQWMLSRLHSTVKEVDEHLASYRITETTRVLSSFVDEMSNWYVRRSRERFWGSEMTSDKISAYMTLYTCLVTLAKTAAPMIPFMAEEIYRNLVCTSDKTAPESVHLCDYPVADESLIDKELEAQMDEVLKVVVIGRACRNAANIKNRQPLAAMFVKSEEAPLPSYFSDIIADELNVREVNFTSDVSRFTSYSFKPQLRTVGPRYGKQLGQIREALATLDGNRAMAELDSNGQLTFSFADGEVVLTRDDLLIETAQMPGYVSQSDQGFTVALDTNLTPDLIEEGYVREIVSKVQTMRKDQGFQVTDHIRLTFAADEQMTAVLQKNEGRIASDTLADLVGYGEKDGAKEWNINGLSVRIHAERI